jgi:Dolichyl-phosphate-mannose-protein mannosyltransferase
MYYIVAGQHPALGYVDQPPLTPLLSAASVTVLGVSPTAVRVLPALELALVVVLVALMARDLGGSRRAQVLAAITAALSGYLAGGHLDTTSEPDLLARAVILWLLVKLLAGGDRRLWLVLGVVTGIGPGEQGHAPVPGRGAGGGTRPRPALGRRALAVGLGGDRDRVLVVGAEPRLAGGERLAAAHDGLQHRRLRRG